MVEIYEAIMNNNLSSDSGGSIPNNAKSLQTCRYSMPLS